MPRHKGFDRTEVLEVAMQLFWARGFRDVSTRDLSSAMDINPNSLYAEFGSKADLFSAALEHYEQQVLPRFIGQLEEPGASRDTIRSVFQGFAAVATTGGVLAGCFIINTASEHTPTLEDSQRTTARYVDRLVAAFTNALTEPATACEPTDTAATARFLAATLIGIFVMLRAQTTHEVIADAVNVALLHLQPAEATADRPIHALAPIPKPKHKEAQT